MIRVMLFGVGVFLGVLVAYALRRSWRAARIMVWLKAEQLDE